MPETVSFTYILDKILHLLDTLLDEILHIKRTADKSYTHLLTRRN